MRPLAEVAKRFSAEQSPAGIHVGIDELRELVDANAVSYEDARELLESCLGHYLAGVRMDALTLLARIDAQTWTQRLVDVVLEDIEKSDAIVEIAAACEELTRVASADDIARVRSRAERAIRAKHGRDSPGPRSAVEALIGLLQGGHEDAVDGLVDALKLSKSLAYSQQAAAKAMRLSRLPRAKAAYAEYKGKKSKAPAKMKPATAPKKRATAKKSPATAKKKTPATAKKTPATAKKKPAKKKR